MFTSHVKIIGSLRDGRPVLQIYRSGRSKSIRLQSQNLEFHRAVLVSFSLLILLQELLS